MNLNSVREGELKEIFDALEEAFSKLDIDFYLIGAIARDICMPVEKRTLEKPKMWTLLSWQVTKRHMTRFDIDLVRRMLTLQQGAIPDQV